MARKNILGGLTTPKLTAVNSSQGRAAPSLAITSFAARGAAGSLTRSIDDLAAKAGAAKELEAKLTAGQTVVELDAALIDPSFVSDRMATAEDEAYDALRLAIAKEGQGSPILVRPHPDAPGRYQVAFGHRRLRVALDIGRPVRAVIKALSDQELVLAQGQENSLRVDLSFIERARFANSLVQLNYGRDVVMAGLAVDKTTVSRMLSVTRHIPSAVIDAVGPAPATGRDRWVDLASQFEANAEPAGLKALLRDDEFLTALSDDRFARIGDLFNAEGEARNAKPEGQGARHDVQSWGPAQGNKLVTLKHNARSCIVNIDQRQAPGFGDFLLRHMERLYGEYLAGQKDK